MSIKMVAHYALGPIGAGALSVLTLPFITWFFEAEDVGRVAMLQVAISFGTLIFTLGLDQAFVREYHEAGDRARLLVSTILPSVLVLVLAALAVLAIDSNLISSVLYSISASNYSVFTVLAVAVGVLSRFFSLLLRMEGRALAFSSTQVSPKAFFLLFILLVIPLGLSRNFNTLFVASILSFFGSFIITLYLVRSALVDAFQSSPVSLEIKKYLLFGLPFMVGGVASWSLNLADRVLLRSFSSLAELGVYSVSASIAAGVAIGGSILTTIWVPTVYRWVSQGESREKIVLVGSYAAAGAYFLFSFSGLVLWIVPFFLPENYRAVQFLLPACVAAPVFYALSEITGVGIGISRRSALAMVAAIVAAGFNGVIGYFLIPEHGASGAAIATSVSFFLYLVLRTEFSVRAWEKIPRAKLYCSSLLSLVCVLTTLALSIQENFLLIALWVSHFVVGLIMHKEQAGVAISKLRQYIQSDKVI